MGFSFTLALSTDEALQTLSKERFAAIISDMGRQEGPREGYRLLDAVHRKGDKIPFFIYAGYAYIGLPSERRSQPITMR